MSESIVLVHSPPLEGWPMHFAMHAFSSHVEVLNKVTPIDLLVQSAVLFSLTGWLCRICMIYTFIHPIYGNRYLLAQAVGVVQNGTLGQKY